MSTPQNQTNFKLARKKREEQVLLLITFIPLKSGMEDWGLGPPATCRDFVLWKQNNSLWESKWHCVPVVQRAWGVQEVAQSDHFFVFEQKKNIPEKKKNIYNFSFRNCSLYENISFFLILMRPFSSFLYGKCIVSFLIPLYGEMI